MTCRVDPAKGNRRHRCSAWHRDLVEGYRLARYAQDQRAEEYSIGYRTELAEFYRDVETSLAFRDWLLGMADRNKDAQPEAAASAAA